ncbi:hypothetical protein Aperf_G00000084196 [Anoplocephala perfoliata]
MADSDDLISQIKKLKKSQLASEQPSMQRYKSMVKKAVSDKFETAERKRVFRQAKTDFQRICFLLQAFKSSRKGLEQLIQLAISEEIEEINGKSDRKSELFRLYSAVAWNSKEIDEALSASTNAVFYAVSPEQKALAFARRCNILYNLGLIKEAILDGEYALTFPCPQDEAGHVHLCLGECFRILNNISEARRHFELAISKLTRKEEAGQSELLSRAQQGLTHCTVEMTEIERPPSWQSFRPQPPQLVKRWTELSSDDLTEEKNEEISCRLLSSPKGLLGLKYMGQKIGWSLQLKKDIFAGEVLIVEKPYAISLSSERTSYCCFCYKRCHNLIPCRGCAHVGFCSQQCADDAVKADRRLPEGREGMQHIFDCHGLLPCILVKNGELAHAVFSCIANTNQECLLNYICSTGKYEVA